MARSTARKRALNTLYEADEKSQDFLSLLEERKARPGAQTPLPAYAVTIVEGVAEHRRNIDEALQTHSTRWPLSRMHAIDRNILRIAAWEMFYNPDVPDKVAIDEALSLAKTLSDADAPSFIHGVLSALEQEKDEHQARREQADRIAALADAEADADASDDESDKAKAGIAASEPVSSGDGHADSESESAEGTHEDEDADQSAPSLDQLKLTLPKELTPDVDLPSGD
ncbi:transcription antitermination factor NusB [Bifidobacterium sp. B4081]|uniref:transcription antitermination factor NusB n=1 Tax=unclassified Bifidobacterium TaxID=2608897 RepID=UPI00226A9C75|nr:MULTISPECIES: transcription antitermination factor NusB [unclassified Bifidobacterium]MCX8643384.1 transcription antitermination factor NusB [Bifidobacterium sp. B4077]MCX8645566.1 transcription antitermination factor NusB [Bifidobacterium sp. B4081]MCX8647193.1 transcription antitermination factor NusB [Bifidobacterium sp. B4107]MCX8651373.1 transcription antitermination factor NusB [Bifidobacterium sp. B4111]MCX8657803.1 transcription antitermination factor NusB [Bifidobacterium sp. B4114